MSSSTFNALFARGVDSSIAQTLADSKYTITQLKQKSQVELERLGLSPEQAQSLLDESRPAISSDIVNRLLFNSKRTCCICRNPKSPIIIHHIVEWHKSRSHAEDNLVVLCLHHHDEAHTKKGLSLALSEKELRSHKEQWEEKVRTIDTKAILGLKDTSDYARWDWVNIRRVSELFLQLGLTITSDRILSQLKILNIIDINNLLTDPNKWNTATPRFYYLDFGEGMYVGYYLDKLVRKVVNALPLNDITKIKSRSELKSILKPGMFISIQRAFYFRSLEKKRQYGGQEMREAYYQGHGIRISFVYDAWYCTSSSARADSMYGHKQKTVLGFVNSITESESFLEINLSCLAAGSYFASLYEGDSN